MNSNPWFSAVSDYSLQLALYLKSIDKKVLYCADATNTRMQEKCHKNQLHFKHLPLYYKPFFKFFAALFHVTLLLFRQRKFSCLFVFEGREHTIACLTKIFFPFLWKNKKLVRIRGQAQIVKKRWSSFLTYRHGTDKTVFTAKILENLFPYRLPEEKKQICFYGKTENFPSEKIRYYHFAKQNFDLYFNDNILTFFMLGRFDEIKGHDLLIESFTKANFKSTSVQLICVGTRQNTSAQECYDKYKDSQIYTQHFKQDSLYHLASSDHKKRIVIIEEHFNDALLFMKNSTFGVISSLGSETICRVGVEFLQAGIPTIYSAVGALPEVFRDFPELKFQNGDVHSFIEKFEFAHEIYIQPERYAVLSAKAHETWENNYRGDIYSQILTQ